MKRLFLFIGTLFVFVLSFAVSPNLQDITLTATDGTTLDFYADSYNKVVYHSPGADFSRSGTFYLGSTISNRNGYVEAHFSVEIAMSYGTKTLEGTIYYNNSTGTVQSVTLNGYVYKASGKVVRSR